MGTKVLFEEIKGVDKNVASLLKEADLVTDAELQSLSQEDLRDLLPGLKNAKRRKVIFDIIHQQKPINVLLQKLRDFIPQECLCAALTTNGVLVDYLNVLKDLKTQMNKMQEFLDAHIGLLEEFSKSQPPQDQEKGSSSSTSLSSGSLTRQNSQTSNSPQMAGGHGSRSSRLFSSSFSRGHTQKTQVKVTYETVVCGKTFGADQQLLDKLKVSSGEPDLILLNQEDYQVVIVFCPVVSRAGTDADAALKKVEDRESVILVLMHHTHAVKSVPSIRAWGNVVLCVNVFYHETMHGLLQCQENDNAISEIRKGLMSRSVQTTENTSGNAENESKSWFPFFQSK